MPYAEDDKERVRAATNILDLIGGVTTVKRSGRTYMAVCPFHQEKTPSMSIDAARGLYYCHGCHAKGDIFSFVQETQGLTFPEALETLARQAGITLAEDPAAARRRGERDALVEAVRLAVRFYHRRLRESPDAGLARAYLRNRGYDAEVVADFELGYAPADGDALVRELRGAGVPDRVAVAAQLVSRGRGGSIYDYFRDRVLFPIRDLRGDPVGFGGRVLGDAKPKYLNTRESAVYHKSRLLYGLDRAKTEISKAGYAVVVEGYTDVIALHRAGMPVAVATCGTALGEEHFDLLRRFADRIVLAFDADQAGAGAALRGDTLETPVRLDLDLRVAVMPGGMDPADLVQAGRVEELRAAVQQARPLLRFRIERELARFDLTEPEERARALHVVGPLVGRVSDEIARTEYARFVAMELGVELEGVLRAAGDRRARPSPRRAGPASRPAAIDRAERELLRAILANDDRLQAADVEAGIFQEGPARAAFQRVEAGWRESAPGAPVPLEARDDEVGELLLALATDTDPPADPAELLATLRRNAARRRIAELRRQVEQLPAGSQEYSDAMRELIRLEHEKRGSA
jgi:DNA primase